MFFLGDTSTTEHLLALCRPIYLLEMYYFMMMFENHYITTKCIGIKIFFLYSNLQNAVLLLE